MSDSIASSDVGLGLRFSHFDSILNSKPKPPWFEVIADDYLTTGPHHKKLLELRQEVPIVFHSIGLNIGGVDSFNEAYLAQFKELYHVFQPSWISDHLCWSAHNGNYHHDLLPIPKTKEALRRVCERIHSLQDYFSQRICLENITDYIDYKNEDFTEIEFIRQIVHRTECKLLLDISNVIINHKNRNKDPMEFFDQFPLEEVTQVHLSGGSTDNGVLIDSHSESVQADDIGVLKELVRRGLRAPAMIERDTNIPEYSILEKERQKIKRSIDEVR